MENLGEDLKEVVNEGGGFKKVIIGIISTIAISAMGLIGKIINDKFLGGSDDADKTEVVSNTQQQSNNQQVIINIPEQKATETKVVERVVEKPASTPPPKPKEKEDVEW